MEVNMLDVVGPAFTVESLLAERKAKQRREENLDDALRQQERERNAAIAKQLATFEVTDQHRRMVAGKVRDAVNRGDTEIMLACFPAQFCSDGGRAINNTDVPPINPPERDKTTSESIPEWVDTLPAGFKRVYALWKEELKPGGFRFSAGIISYPNGKLGNVGLFLCWEDPKASGLRRNR
jgi:hypothetical protein